MFTKLQDFFAEYDFDFVLLFGSFVNGTTHELSDVDIGIYSWDDIKLQELGYMTAMLEKALNKKVDIVLLNKIEQKDPNFAFSILENHQTLVVKNQERYVAFKTRVQLSYLDHKELIEQNLRGVQKRLESDNFARRNYA